MTLTSAIVAPSVDERMPDTCDRRPARLPVVGGKSTLPPEVPRSHFLERRFERGVRIDFARDPAGQLIEVLEGTVLLVRIMPDGRRQVLEVLGTGALMGRDPSERDALFAETRSRVRIRIHPGEGSDAVRTRYNAQMTARVSALHELTASMGRRTAVERVAAFLASIGGIMPPAGDIPRAKVVPMPLSQTDIADHLGLRAETVCRIVAKLRKEGVIAMPGHARLEVLDVAALLDYAGQRSPVGLIESKLSNHAVGV